MGFVNIGHMVKHSYNNSCPCIFCTRERNKREIAKSDAQHEGTRAEQVLRQKSDRRVKVTVPVHWKRDI